MTTPPLLARALVRLFLRGELHEIVSGDLDEDFRDGLAAGRSPAAARRRYWRQALDSIRASRAHNAGPLTMTTSLDSLWSGLLNDLRYVVRRLAASPGFTTVALVSLAISIGANSAVATVARAALFAPMPVERPDELSFIYWTQQEGMSGMYSDGGADPRSGARTTSNVPYPALLELRKAAGDSAMGTAIGAFTFAPKSNVVIGGQPAQSAGTLLVDGNFFGVVRPPMAIGRGLSDADDRPGAEPVAVIGYEFWQRAAAGSPTILEVPVNVNGVPVRIVGVTARGFRGMSPGGFRPTTDISLPLALQPRVVASWSADTESLFTDLRRQWVRPIARIDPRASRDTFEALATSTLRGFVVSAGVTDASGSMHVNATLVSAARGVDISSASTKASVTTLGTIVVIVLLITCLNLAGLTLARSVARTRELSVRAALGASRWRLIRLGILESIVLAIGGAALGLALTFAGRAALSAMLLDSIGPVTGTVEIDTRLLLITLAVASASAMISGLVPAFQLSSRRMTSGLQQRPGGTTAPRQWAGRVMLAIQIAASIPLLAGAGLLLRTINNLTHVNLGFEPNALLTFRVDAPPDANGEAPIAAYDRMLARVREVPGVRSASLVENPLVAGLSSSRDVMIRRAKKSVYTNAVAADFFDTIGAPLIAGRALDDRDAAGPEHAVINKTAADRLELGVGAHLLIPASGPESPERDIEVVGIVADVKYTSLRAPIPATVFDHFARHARGWLPGVTFMVRADGAAPDLERPLREAVASVTPNVAATSFRTQAAQIDSTLGRERVFARLLTIFGLFALLLACVGLHGITSYSVERRTNEIGVRIALGARRSQVLWMIQRQVVILGVVGLILGIPAAIAAGPILKTLVFGLTANDPWTLAGAGLVMLAITALAGWLPARRAASLDPLRAIRRD